MRSSDSERLDTAKRSAADVLHEHLQPREAAELEEDHDMLIVDGVDSYLIEDGLIKTQPIHYRVLSRELSLTWDAAAQSLQTASGQ